MQKFRIFLISSMLAVCACSFIWLGSFVPARIDAQYKGAGIDSTQELDLSDFDITVKSLFGYPCHDVSMSVTSTDANKTAVIYADSVHKSFALPYHEIASWQVKYDGKLYAGQLPDASKISASVVWADGSVHKVRHVRVNNAAVPSEKTYNLSIYAGSVSYKQKLSVVQIKKLSAFYTGDQLSGGAFRQKDITVAAEYEDGTENNIYEYFAVPSGAANSDAISYKDISRNPDLQDSVKTIKNGETLQVYTPYGNTLFKVSLPSVTGLQAFYDGSVYEGDRPDKNSVSLKISLSDGTERTIKSDISWDPVRVFFPSDFDVKTNYGNTSLHIDPVRIIETRGYSDSLKSGSNFSVKHVQNFYADGTTRDLDMEYIKWLNMPTKLKAEDQMVWAQSDNVQYPVHIFAGKNDQYRDQEQYGTYRYTTDLARQLGLIAKSSGNGDETSMVDELCVMMNRFELYGSKKEQGNALYLYNYVVKSGLWGGADTIAAATTGQNLSDEELWIIMDMLQNGYRLLPQYIDMRVSFTGVESKNSLDFEKDETDMIIGGEHFRYYASGKDDNTVYGYSDEAYRKVTGNAPKASDPVNTKEKRKAIDEKPEMPSDASEKELPEESNSSSDDEDNSPEQADESASNNTENNTEDPGAVSSGASEETVSVPEQEENTETTDSDSGEEAQNTSDTADTEPADTETETIGTENTDDADMGAAGETYEEVTQEAF